MLALYCDVERVVRPGDRVLAHVATSAARFRLELHRFGVPGSVAWRSAELEGGPALAGRADEDWRWPAYPVQVPDESGLYILVGAGLMGARERPAPHLIGYDGTALLAVPPARPRAAALYKLPMRTYHAYNPAGGASLYIDPPYRDGAAAVSLSRPGGGTGGPSAEAADVYGLGSVRQTFWHWDAPFLAWARQAGYDFDVVFDTQLDRDPGLLAGYRAMVTAGHDEYWTAAGRKIAADHVEAGGSLAVFGANTCWWQAAVAEGVLRVAKDPADITTGPGLWWQAGEPENELLGLSYRNGGGWWAGARPQARYRVDRPGDPLLAGVDIAELEALTHLAGYEADGHAYPPGSPAAVSGPGGAPDGFRVLAHAEMRDEPHGRWDHPAREPGSAAPAIATIGYRQHGPALVFNAGTTDWARHLHVGAVDRLTRNVLDRIGAAAPRS
jgi:hypothetical protein